MPPDPGVKILFSHEDVTRCAAALQLRDLWDVPTPRAPARRDSSALSCCCHQSYPEGQVRRVPQRCCRPPGPTPVSMSRPGAEGPACGRGEPQPFSWGSRTALGHTCSQLSGPLEVGAFALRLRHLPARTVLTACPHPHPQDAGAAAKVPGPVHRAPADAPGHVAAEGECHVPPGSPARGPAPGTGSAFAKWAAV